MSVLFVQSDQVVEVNAQSYQWPNYPDGISKQIPCENVEIINSFWKIPQMQGNRVVGYNYLVATDDQKPTPDSLKILRVKDTRDNTEYGFAIADTDNIATSSPPNEFAYLCDGTGGTLPVMPTVTIPVPIMQSDPQSTATDGTNTFLFPFPANPNALEYAIPYPWFNGVAPVTAFAPSGLTTVADVVIWANANWGDYGTWTAASTNVLKLESATSVTIPVSQAGMEVSLTATNFCLTLNVAADAVNGIKISGQVYPITAMLAGRTNRQALIDAIRKYFPGATFSTSVTNKINVLTTQLPEAITYNDVNVTGLTWSAGVCA